MVRYSPYVLIALLVVFLMAPSYATAASAGMTALITDDDDAAALLSQSRFAEARPAFERLYKRLVRELGPEHPETLTAAQGLATVLTRLGELDQAIFYAQLAVQGAQEQRRIQAKGGLSASLRKSSLATKESYYHHLSSLFIKAGRVNEAQAVLLLLKENEVGAELLDAGQVQEDSVRSVPCTAAESVLLHEYFITGNRLAALDKEKRVLQAERIGTAVRNGGSPVATGNITVLGIEQRQILQRSKDTRLTPEEEERLRFLDAEIDKADKAYWAFMDSLPQRLKEASEQVRDDAKRLENLESLQGTLRALGEGVALIHTLSTDEALYVFLTTPDVLLVRSSPVGRQELETKVAELHSLLRAPENDPTQAAQTLYQWIIAPVADELGAAGITTIMFALDGALRYIPMAALHDGTKWLIESYAVAMFTEAARDKIILGANFNVEATALGMTQAVEDFPSLPAVRREVEAIVRTSDKETGVLPGSRLLDQNFTYTGLSNGLRQGTPVIHIASHFHFDSITPGRSFLVLGDGKKLYLSDLKTDRRLPFTDVDQLTLSACDTGFGVGKGDGREVEGFGALAQKRGAHSVLATLWPVADESTGKLMQDFYRIRFIEKQDRASALRQAQLHLMGQTSGGDAPDKRGVAVSTTQTSDITSSSPNKFTGYSHPYYWAPFILMGNWK